MLFFWREPIRKQARMILTQLEKDVIERYDAFKYLNEYNYVFKKHIKDSDTDAIYIIEDIHPYHCGLVEPFKYAFNVSESKWLFKILKKYDKKVAQEEEKIAIAKTESFIKKAANITYEKHKKIIKEGK